MEVDFFEILSRKTPRKHDFPVFSQYLGKSQKYIYYIVFVLNILGKVEKIYVGNFEKNVFYYISLIQGDKKLIISIY